MENNIDRPVIVGALYNGQGEGGIYATPGGKPAQPVLPDLFQRATDHARVGQGNLAGSNSPAWHGASPELGAHNNDAAQWGIRTNQFGGRGYNQLLFDDTDRQGRVQLKCSSAGSELNLGHLIHVADNYRGRQICQTMRPSQSGTRSSTPSSPHNNRPTTDEKKQQRCDRHCFFPAANSW